MNHIVDQRKIYLRHRCLSNFPLCSFCNLCFHDEAFQLVLHSRNISFHRETLRAFAKAFFTLAKTFSSLYVFVENYALECQETAFSSRGKLNEKWKRENSVFHLLRFPFWLKSNSKRCSAEADANTLFPSNIRSCFYTLGGKSWEQENIFGCDKKEKE